MNELFLVPRRSPIVRVTGANTSSGNKSITSSKMPMVAKQTSPSSIAIDEDRLSDYDYSISSKSLIKQSETTVSTYYVQFSHITHEDILKNEKSKNSIIQESLANDYGRLGEIFFATAGISCNRSKNSNVSDHVITCACSKCKKGRLSKFKTKQSNNSNGCYKMIGNNKLIEDILELNQFKYSNATIITDSTTNNDDIRIIWSNQHLKSNVFKSLKKYQRINLFPCSFECTRKDSLANNINRMIQFHGQKHFQFFPSCYVYPKERETIIQEINSNPSSVWIVKPASSSQGNGIYIIQHTSQLPLERARNDDNWIVEKYIENPLLIDGKKFDLRLYVSVTSFNPLKIYLHTEGVARFATEVYTRGNYNNKFEHLTNYSINKHNYAAASTTTTTDTTTADTTTNTTTDTNGYDGNDVGNNTRNSNSYLKLTLDDLNKKLQTMTNDRDAVASMWMKIDDLIVKTLISVESRITAAVNMYVKHPTCCFELFGFDVLIDDKYQPHLMEVNFSPSMNTDSELDFHIKSRVITDLFNLAGIQSNEAIVASSNGNSTTNSSRSRSKSISGSSSSSNNKAALSPKSSASSSLSSYKWAIETLTSYGVAIDDKKKKVLKDFINESDRRYHCNSVSDSNGFRLIYPLYNNISTYSSLFENYSSANIIIAQYIVALEVEKDIDSSSSDIFERLSKNHSNKSIFQSKFARLIGVSVTNHK